MTTVTHISTTTSEVEGATSLTLSVDATGGDCLIVGVGFGDHVTASKTITGVTYNGVALTKIDSQRDTTYNASDCWLGYLLAPPSGAHNVVASVSGSADSQDVIAMGATVLSGVSQSSPIGTPTKAQGEGGGTSLLTLSDVGVSGDLIIDVLANGSPAIDKAGAAQTQRWVQNVNSASSGGCSGGSTAPAGTATMSWNINGDHWVTVGVPIKQAVAATGQGLRLGGRRNHLVREVP